MTQFEEIQARWPLSEDALANWQSWAHEIGDDMVAHAPTDIAALLAEVETLKADIRIRSKLQEQTDAEVGRLGNQVGKLRAFAREHAWGDFLGMDVCRHCGEWRSEVEAGRRVHKAECPMW